MSYIHVIRVIRHALSDDKFAIFYVVIAHCVRNFWITQEEKKVQHEVAQLTFAIFVDWIHGKISEEAIEASFPEFLDATIDLVIKLSVNNLDNIFRILR